MSSYLEEYGEAQARHSRKLRWMVLTPLVLAILGVLAYFQFRDFREHRRARNFLELVQQKDYKAAYALWGCTEQAPCSRYPFAEFMKDWGPSGELGNPDQARIADEIGCHGGVIATVRTAAQKDIQIWVDRRSGEIGFAPWRLKKMPPGFRVKVATWMWSITQNCDPLIDP